MDVTILTVQPVSIFRAKLWKVVVKYEIVFLIFGFFSKCTFQVATFSLAKYLSNQLSLLIQSKLSVVVCTHKIHVFDEAFFLLAIVAMITEKNIVFLFSWQPLLGKNLFIKPCSLSIQNMIEKNGLR